MKQAQASKNRTHLNSICIIIRIYSYLRVYSAQWIREVTLCSISRAIVLSYTELVQDILALKLADNRTDT